MEVSESGSSRQLTTKEIRRNMICVILLDAIFCTGWTDLMLAVQPFLSYLKASNLMIGLISGAGWAGLPGVLLSPFITRRFRYKKWYMFCVHIPYLLPIAAAGIGVIYSQKLGLTENSTMLSFVLVVFLVHWFFGGFVSLPHQEYVAAVIPMSHRGRYSGFSSSIGGVMSIVAASLGGIILLRVSQPIAYGYIFLMSWFILQSGYISSLFAKELPTPVEKSPAPWSKSMVTAVWADKPFVRLIALQMLATMTLIPIFGFVNIYGFKELHMLPATSALIQLITQIARISSSFLIGLLTDRLGPKRVLPYWMLVAAVSLSMPIFIPNAYGVYTSVVFSTVYTTGAMAAFMALVYGLPKPENRAGHFTVQLILFYIANSLGGIMVGRVCDVLSFRTAFTLFAVIALLLFPLAKYVTSSLSDNLKSYS